MYCGHISKQSLQNPPIVDSSEYICPKCSTKFSGAQCPVCREHRAAIADDFSPAEVQKEVSKNKSFGYLAIYLIVAAVLGRFSPEIVIAGAFVGCIIDLNSSFSHKPQSIGMAVVLIGKWCIIGFLAFIPAMVVGVLIYGGFAK